MSAPEFSEVVVDGDPMVYAIGSVTENEPLNYALSTARKAVQHVQESAQSQSYDLYIQGASNFRDSLAISNSYKAGRASRKPKHFHDIRRYMQEYLGATVVEGMETDDAVSILLWDDFVQHKGDPDACEVILASADKDLINTPGWHMGTVRSKQNPHFVSEHESEEHFWYQMLAGDPVDTIKGLQGITKECAQMYDVRAGGCGPTNANKILAKIDPEDYEQEVYDLYLQWSLDKDLTEELAYEYFREQGQLLWMVRELRADGSPVLWEPSVKPPAGYVLNN